MTPYVASAAGCDGLMLFYLGVGWRNQSCIGDVSRLPLLERSSWLCTLKRLPFLVGEV